MRTIEVYEGKVEDSEWGYLKIGEDNVEYLLNNLEGKNVRITVEILPEVQQGY